MSSVRWPTARAHSQQTQQWVLSAVDLSTAHWHWTVSLLVAQLSTTTRNSKQSTPCVPTLFIFPFPHFLVFIGWNSLPNFLKTMGQVSRTNRTGYYYVIINSKFCLSNLVKGACYLLEYRSLWVCPYFVFKQLLKINNFVIICIAFLLYFRQFLLILLAKMFWNVL